MPHANWSAEIAKTRLAAYAKRARDLGMSFGEAPAPGPYEELARYEKAVPLAAAMFAQGVTSEDVIGRLAAEGSGVSPETAQVVKWIVRNFEVAREARKLMEVSRG